MITTAGNLPARFVIHTVGPVWNGGDKGEEKKLTDCYRNSLQLAVDNKCSTIAFPNISTGVYRFPKAAAAQIAVHTVADFLDANETLGKVIFVCFDEESYELTSKEMMLL